MKRREELVQTYLQQADGNPRRALAALRRAFEEISLEVPDEFVAYLMAKEKLEMLAAAEAMLGNVPNDVEGSEDLEPHIL